MAFLFDRNDLTCRIITKRTTAATIYIIDYDKITFTLVTTFQKFPSFFTFPGERTLADVASSIFFCELVVSITVLTLSEDLTL